MGAEDLVLPMAFGPYELLRLVAAGGMARVYEARVIGPHGFVKRLAVKMMLSEYAGDADFVAMLIDEAKIAVQLAHSNICQVLDLGLIDGRYYITMEYVDGADLNRVVNRGLQREVPIPFDVVARIGHEICAGLDYAHAKTDEEGRPLRIIHRDVSPANILISMAGEVKIVDFGVAKAASRTQQHTNVGVVKGKYQYMSPEQVSGGELDHRTDIFSAGIVLYETIAGRMMYPDGPDMLERIRHAAMRPLEVVRPDVPNELARIIAKALSRMPQDRYQTAGEFSAALTEFLLGYREQHRLSDVMEALFGDEARAEQPKRPSAESKPRSQKDIVDRGGSLVRNPAFEAEAQLEGDAIEPEEVEPAPSTLRGQGERRAPLDLDDSTDVDEPERTDSIDVEVDLTFLGAGGTGRGSSLYMVRDPLGRSSGPFSRAQLHELVLSGDITENHEVLPVSGAGAPDDERTSQWMPAAGHVPVFEPIGAPSHQPYVTTPARSTDLSLESAARVLLDIAVEGVTGVALFDRPGAHKEVTFQQGAPLYASSNLPAEQLGERLVRLGYLTRIGLGQGLRAATTHRKLLGQALVDLGLLDEETLHGCLHDLIRARLLELFLWRSGTVSFHAGEPPAPPFLLSVNPFDLIIEGIDHAAGTEGAVGWLLELEDRSLVLSGETRSRLELLGLPAETFTFLDRFAQPKRVRDVLDALTGHDFAGAQVARILMLAVHTGYLAVVPDQLH